MPCDGRRVDHRLLHQLRRAKRARGTFLQQLRISAGSQGTGPARRDGAPVPAPVRACAADQTVPVV